MKFSSLIRKLGRKTASNEDGAQIPAPVLGPVIRFPYGAFQLKAGITKGVAFEIEATTDLEHWQTIATETDAAETIEYVDSDASKFSHRYYRIKAGTVYSANVMGYAAVTLALGFSMIANPFVTPNNSVTDLLKDLPDGTRINRFDTRFFKLTENFSKVAGGPILPKSSFPVKGPSFSTPLRITRS
jgi:hypothetical protein